MRIVASCLALFFVALALPVLAADPPSATAAVCRAIEKNQCEGSSSRFTSDVGKLHGFSQVVNVPDKIVHVWFFKDKELGRLEIKAPNAPRWKAFSNVTVARNMAGPWRLEVRDGSGTVLATFNFTLQ
jgi:hypothetical protein